MLLQRLVEYADKLDLPPRLYSEGPVRYRIQLNATGRLRNREPIDTANPSSPRSRRGVRRLVPQVQRAVKIKPLLLADKADYTFGLAPDDSSERAQKRALDCHQAYLELVDRCAAATAEPAVEAVQAFLHNDPLGQLELPADFDPGAIITFQVNEMFPIDLPPVQAFWASEHDPVSDNSTVVMQCLTCGERRPVLGRLQGKIKGVPGGQSSGTAIISANAPAFESYGLEASLIAPTCARCGEKFTKAVNALLADRRQRVILGNTAFIFWTREDVGFSFMESLMTPEAKDFQTLLESLLSAARMPHIDPVDFYAAALAASGGRTAVRDWIDTTVGSALRQIALWFRRQRIVGPWGQDPAPLGLRAIALATVREAKDLPPTVSRALLRCALTGAPLPLHLLYEAVRRNRAEQGVTRPRAALIKLVLLSQDATRDRKEDFMVELDRGNPDPAYHCGRLLAVLEDIQRRALPTAKATIVDRFYGTASSAPASVFGRLLRGGQPHLAKLERDRPGAYHALQARLEEILSGLPAFPRTLTLEQQGVFSLGYYHQRAFDRAKAKEAREAFTTTQPSDQA